MDVAKIDGINNRKSYHIASAVFAIPKSDQQKHLFCNYIMWHKIDTIINVSDFAIPKDILDLYMRCGIKQVLYAPFDDRIMTPEEYPKFLESIKSIHRKLKPYRNILVHCSAGINRSATVISYLIFKTSNHRMVTIIKQIRTSNKKRNKDALTNYTFENLLLSLKK